MDLVKDPTDSGALTRSTTLKSSWYKALKGQNSQRRGILCEHFQFSTENRKTVLDLQFSSGRIVVDGNSGLFGESG